ncbi:hypothetical protein H4R18_005715 [Coemansia javaensis]|uniref:Gluconokinase n=1 Tax=Coemansia javaensis TaxID=2761396 RepID=A0A9W8LEE4_9FUNG|nr:hypothetical protein H4R18_005715 [Coemansia javaensis]
MRVGNSFSTYPVRVVVVMGVAGSGKSSVGARVAERLDGAPFIEADTLHAPECIAKMAAGVALEDADRWPWLMRVRSRIDAAAAAALVAGRRAASAPASATGPPQYVVCACSALKRSYRELISRGDPDALYDTVFVHLDVGRQELLDRLARRQGHFAGPSLLDSQLAALEPPDAAREAAVTIDGARPADRVADEACAWIQSYSRADVQQ